MAWEVATAQSLGGRSNQEDAFLVMETSPMLLAVADGAGGHADGEKASQTAIQTLKTGFTPTACAGAAARPWLTQTIGQAHRRVSALGDGPTAPRTTIVAALLDGARAVVGHVGDSRLYHIRQDTVVFRTRDHSVVQLLVDMGRLAENEMLGHPDRSRLTKALGGRDEVDAEIDEVTIAAGDGFALCSDGVWEFIDPREFAAALRSKQLNKAAQDLVAQAVSRGGSDADNATLILARLR